MLSWVPTWLGTYLVEIEFEHRRDWAVRVSLSREHDTNDNIKLAPFAGDEDWIDPRSREARERQWPQAKSNPNTGVSA